MSSREEITAALQVIRDTPEDLLSDVLSELGICTTCRGVLEHSMDEPIFLCRECGQGEDSTTSDGYVIQNLWERSRDYFIKKTTNTTYRKHD